MKLTGIQNFNSARFAPEKQNNNAKKENKTNKLGVALFSAGATLLPVLALGRRQGKALSRDIFQNSTLKQKGSAILNSLSIEYGFKEMMLVGLTSILGGVAGGMIFDKEVKPHEKAKEGVAKALALIIPTSLVAASVGICKQVKIKDPLRQISSVAVGVGLGMPFANDVSNKVNQYMFKDEKCQKRKVKPSDYLMHIDDVVGAMVLCKVPFVQTLQLDKLLSVIYAHEGYEAGSAK